MARIDVKTKKRMDRAKDKITKVIGDFVESCNEKELRYPEVVEFLKQHMSSLKEISEAEKKN